MLCKNCGKREVEVLIKQVINDEVEDINLCRLCAEELGFLSSQLPSITISFSLREVDDSQRKKIVKLYSKKDEEKFDGIVCPECGILYRDVRKDGLLGCPECYQAFRFPLGVRLQLIQGAESHWEGTSRVFSEIAVLDPDELSRARLLEQAKEEKEAAVRKLKHEIEDAAAREDYETAARLRDRLKSLREEDDGIC